MRPSRWALAVLLLALSSAAPPAQAQERGKAAPPAREAGRARPTELVKATVDRVLAVVQSSPAPVSEGRRRSDIRQLADGLFDFEEMSRLTLAGHWKGRTPAEQHEFVRLFTALLERSYLSSIENYAGEKIAFLSESVSGSYAQVRSRITTERRLEISIDYRLLDTGTRWWCTTWCSTGEPRVELPQPVQRDHPDVVVRRPPVEAAEQGDRRARGSTDRARELLALLGRAASPEAC
jgi:ABC-type transporter MlaC component